MKSDLDSSKPHKKQEWRLSRTLKRATDFRPIEEEDVKYAWAAYKKGALASMGDKFSDGLMSPEEFNAEFVSAILSGGYSCWVLFSNNKHGFSPIGIVLGAEPFPGASYILINGMCWFPWASKRNIVEAMVCFLNGIRKQIPLMFFSLHEHKKLYEVCMKHGIVRRVGTSYGAIPGMPSAVFETRAP